MKLFLFVFCALALAACETTGDWNEDSLFFSPRKADAELNNRRARLHAIEGQSAETARESRDLEDEIDRQRAQHRVESGEARELQQEIDKLDRTLEDTKKELAGVQAANAPNAEREHQLQDEIAGTRMEIAKKRKRLNLIISHR